MPRQPVCQACWQELATTKSLATSLARCGACADANCPARVDLFPPLGIYRLTWSTIRRGEARHRGPGSPQTPPNPGPPLPPGGPAPSPPGTPPV
ncbi:hypothetical protein [Streptomyces sp. WMMC940]|uniref:hypothetical protein n=1 Tax=Streptomyces sp. WMMC940 TaxID=3015153 RepID=UPI0022B73455|nr:hypothetical protein [Streptomyces sp. WMMC940]MCZ7460131.1 hypothetical protein [Streptomyces sp. WMMC940]